MSYYENVNLKQAKYECVCQYGPSISHWGSISKSMEINFQEHGKPLIVLLLEKKKLLSIKYIGP